MSAFFAWRARPRTSICVDGVCNTCLQANSAQTVFKPNDFLIASKLANVNLLEVVHALEQDHLVHKIAGYADTLARQRAADAEAGSLGAVIAQQENARQNAAVRTSSLPDAAAANAEMV